MNISVIGMSFYRMLWPLSVVLHTKPRCHALYAELLDARKGSAGADRYRLRIGIALSSCPASYDDYASELEDRLRLAYTLVRNHLKVAAERNKRYYCHVHPLVVVHAPASCGRGLEGDGRSILEVMRRRRRRHAKSSENV